MVDIRTMPSYPELVEAERLKGGTTRWSRFYARHIRPWVSPGYEERLAWNLSRLTLAVNLEYCSALIDAYYEKHADD